VQTGTLVTLHGDLSSDPDNDPLTYRWTQVSGPPVSVTGATRATPSFTAPLLTPPTLSAPLVFALTVSDGELTSTAAGVTVTVLTPDAPPQCASAQASPTALWPPNHKMAPVRITGNTDPDNDQITLTVTAVTQDEPVLGLSDADTGPDAVLQADGTILLRAERADTGNGRVYQIAFTASDGLGGQCAGHVTVCVPPAPGKACHDDGQGYSALQP